MPFLGSTPADKYKSLAKQTITGDGSVAYTLSRSVTNAYDMEVFINNIRQEPDTSYSASGNTITFTAAVTASDSCYLIYQGQSVGSINPPANSVGSSQVANNTITTAHLHTGLSVPDSNIAAMAASKLTGNVATSNMPAGSVIQAKRLVTNNVSSSSSTSWATHMSGQLDNTPQVGSLIIAMAHGAAFRGSDSNWGSGFAIYLNSTNMAQAYGVGNDGSYAAGRSGMVGSYWGQSFQSSGHHTITSSDVSGGNPTFYLKFSEMSGGGSTIYVGSGNTATSSNYATDTTSMLIWEIAQ